jgi:type I restriction enzyme S subunit
VRSVALAEVGRIVSGATPKTHIPEYWDGAIPWVTPADLANNDEVYFTGPCERITDVGYKSCSTVMLPPGSVLFSSRAPIGHSAIVATPVCTNQGFKSFIPGPDLDPLFTYFAIRAITPKIVSAGRGATFAEVNTEIMENVRLPYTDITDQRRIGARLLKSHRLVRTHRFALQMSKGLLGAVFLETFGDPQLNPNAFPIQSLGEVAKLVTDGEHATPIRTTSGIKLLSARNIQNGYVDLEPGVDFVGEEEFERIRKRCWPRRNDILISCSGSVGRVTLVRTDEPMVMVRSVALVKLDPERVDGTYVECLLQTRAMQSQIARGAHQSSQANLFIGPIKELQCMTPSLQKQRSFFVTSADVRRLRASQMESLRQAEHLFQTLLHEAFGETA